MPDAESRDAMLRRILDARTLVALTVAAAVGAWGLRAYPVRMTNVFLASDRRCGVRTCFQVLAYGYATLWFTTPFFVRVAARRRSSRSSCTATRRALTFRALPPYPEPETRPAPSLVLGEAHHRDASGTRARPARG